ncbi:hypothetical protein DV515_00014489 [Chloebia gouldiae]|uniref:Uncharacterized protein n=1 Tax=Chloebia gouldiae TaxID=44316 RepID=A0A3L8RYF6_CHLGU|nr:hypothetical protein DV515_00014489 [Chloebia gouldiae]
MRLLPAHGQARLDSSPCHEQRPTAGSGFVLVFQLQENSVMKGIIEIEILSHSMRKVMEQVETEGLATWEEV